MYTIWNENRKLTNAEKYMLKMSNIPKYQWQEDNLTPDDIDIESFDRLAHIREKLNIFFNKYNGLVICGNNLGCGKTSWALKLMLTFFEMHNDDFIGVDSEEVDAGKLDIGIFLQTVPFMVKLKQFGSNKDAIKLYNRMESTKLLVLDDIAAVPMSQYDYNILYAIVETRMFANLPCIFTTNATSEEELAKDTGPRVAERIWKNSLVIELKGRGYRSL